MTDFLQDVFDTLSEDEKKVLENIQTKLSANLEQQKKEKIDKIENTTDPYIDFSKENPDIIHSKHLTDSANELIFTVRAEASTIGEKGQLVSVVDIIEKFYHIPIDLKEDHKPYMDRFFDNFHNTLEETCKIINLNKKA
jgi:hypothetical protein